MIRHLAAGAAALFAFAGATQASPAVGSGLPVALSPGEQVTLAPGRGGAFVVTDVRPVTIGPEVPPASREADQEYMMTPTRAPSFTTPSGTVRFSLWATPSEGARLKLENNSGRPLIYSAQIMLRGDPTPHATSICSVQPGRAGYELWPDNIVAIRITGFYPAQAGAQVCGHPERGQVGAPPPSAPSSSGGK